MLETTMLFENDNQHIVMTATNNANLNCAECGERKEHANSTHCIECAVKALGDSEVFEQ